MLSRLRNNFDKLPQSITPDNEKEEWYRNRKIQGNVFTNKERHKVIDDRNQKMFSRLTQIQYVRTNITWWIQYRMKWCPQWLIQLNHGPSQHFRQLKMRGTPFYMARVSQQFSPRKIPLVLLSEPSRKVAVWTLPFAGERFKRSTHRTSKCIKDWRMSSLSFLPCALYKSRYNKLKRWVWESVDFRTIEWRLIHLLKSTRNKNIRSLSC